MISFLVTPRVSALAGCDNNEANATRELEESNGETSKPDIHNLASVEADDKSVETSKIISEQADEVTDAHLETNIALPEEAESRIKKSVAKNVDKSKEANITAMEQSDVDTGLQAEPTADHVEQLEVPEVPDQKSTEHESIISSDDQEEIVREISAIEGADMSFEVTGEEGKPSIQVLDDTSKIVGNECNTNASEHQADIKERSSPGKSVSENSDSVVDLEKVKEMKSMETTLLGAARQAQEQQTPMSLITAHFQVINEASSSSTSSPTASIVQGNLPSSPSIWSDYLVRDQEQECTNESDLVIFINNRGSTTDVVNNKQTVGIVNGSTKVVNGTSLVKREATPLLVKSVKVRESTGFPPSEELRVLPSDESFSWANENYNSVQRSIDVWSFVLSLRVRVLLDNANTLFNLISSSIGYLLFYVLYMGFGNLGFFMTAKSMCLILFLMYCDAVEYT
ncbi:hypothetical protein Tco_0174129 [Tanacetum coccineum]